MARHHDDAELIALERDARRDKQRIVERFHAAEAAAGRRRRPARFPVVVMALIAVIAVVAAGWGIARWVDAVGMRSDADFEAAAVQRVTTLLGSDHRDPGRAQRILDGAVDPFRDEFARSADAYTEFVESRGAVAQASVLGSAVSGRDKGRATVLIYAQVRSEGSAPVPFRLRVLVEDIDGEMKLAAVQYLS